MSGQVSRHDSSCKSACSYGVFSAMAGTAHVTKVSGLDTMDFQSKRGMSVAPHTRTNSIPCGFGASGSAPGCSFANQNSRSTQEKS